MLKRLSLRNFKSFRSAESPLGPLTLIVGANASGKSNIRDALRVLHGIGLGYPLAEILGEKYGPGGILQWRGIRGGVREAVYQGKGACRLEVTMGESSGATAYRYGISISVRDARYGPRVRAESLYDAAGQYVFESRPKDHPLWQDSEHQIRVRHAHSGAARRPSSIPLPLPGLEPAVRQVQRRNTGFASNRPVITQLSSGDDEQEDLRQACAGVLGTLQSLRFLDLDPEAMRQPSQPGQHILGDRGENLSSVLQAICEDPARKQTLLGWLRALAPMDAVDFEFLPDFSGRVLVHLVESHGHKVSALSASDGTLRFLALVAALLSPDTGRIFFFEELDNGLHPTRLHLLLQLIQQACREQGVQVIGTTHNPALLAFLDEQARKDALLVYRTEGAPDSRIRRIAELPDIESVLDKQDLGRLHASGWLEDAAVFSEPDEEEGGEEGEEDA